MPEKQTPNVNIKMPESYYFKAGETLWSKTDPTQKYKVLEVIHAYAGHGAGTIDLLVVQNTITKEVEHILAQWGTKHDPADMWGQDGEYTGLASLEELEKGKPKDMLSSDFLEGKRAQEVLASFDVLGTSEIDTIKVLLADFLTKKSAARISKIESFLDSANYRRTPDDIYWVFDTERRIACSIDESGEIANPVCIVGTRKVRVSDFFQMIPEHVIELATFGSKFLLKMSGRCYEMDLETLEGFLEDYELPAPQVKASLTRTGVWRL